MVDEYKFVTVSDNETRVGALFVMKSHLILMGINLQVNWTGQVQCSGQGVGIMNPHHTDQEMLWHVRHVFPLYLRHQMRAMNEPNWFPIYSPRRDVAHRSFYSAR